MEVEQDASELCSFFIENGFCTLGSNCMLSHEQKLFDQHEIDNKCNIDNKEDDSEQDVTEICFSFDTTGSMYKWLKEVKTKLEEIVKSLFDKITNIRMSFIAHGDYCDADTTYILKYIKFSTVWYYLFFLGRG